MRRSSVDAPGEAGFLTVQFVAAVGLSLLLLASFANLLVQRYAVAAAYAALDEGVRAGSLVGGDRQVCNTRALDALRGLLGGAYGQQVSITCTHNGDRVRATARLQLSSWAPLVPPLDLAIYAEAVAEQ